MKRVRISQICRKNGFLYTLYNLPRLLTGYYPLFLDYPLRPLARWGYGKAAHPELERMLAERAEEYRGRLRGFLGLREVLLRIPTRAPKRSPEPCWINDWLEGLDTLALYGLVAERRPRTYLEVGSGYSTKVVRRAVRDQGLGTRIVSVDPHPRAEIDALCDEVVREPLEMVGLERFAALAPGDILFVDGSHRVFQNSDVTVLFLDILPRLQPGVLVHIHDIYLPADYMPERAGCYYSEQYMLGAQLLAGHQNFEVVLPNAFVGMHPEIGGVLDGFWQEAQMRDVPRGGTSFWVEMK